MASGKGNDLLILRVAIHTPLHCTPADVTQEYVRCSSADHIVQATSISPAAEKHRSRRVRAGPGREIQVVAIDVEAVDAYRLRLRLRRAACEQARAQRHEPGAAPWARQVRCPHVTLLLMRKV